MNDNTIGKMLAIGIFGLIIWGISSLLTAKGEAARRARLVIGGVLALGAAAIWFAMVGPIGFTITLAVIGAGVWIARGNKK